MKGKGKPMAKAGKAMPPALKAKHKKAEKLEGKAIKALSRAEKMEREDGLV